MNSGTAHKSLDEYLRPTFYIDSDSSEVASFARKTSGDASTILEKGVRLYYAVRDGIRYNPYAMRFEKESYRASYVLAQGNGFCVQKAVLLAAVCRAEGVPCRLRFANVRNHLVTERLKELMKTDLFIFHGLTEMFLNGAWVKATPAFNLGLCEKFGVLPLEFDGVNDSIFHPFDRAGRQHMEYVADHGHFADFPYDRLMEETRKYYPHFFEYFNKPGSIPTGNFEKEAAAENRETGK